jgi:2-phosphoglycerate kinase
VPEKVLAIFANPRGSDPLRLQEEDRVIHECLQLARRRRLQLVIRHAATIHDVRRALLNEQCSIVHFSGHGTGSGLVLEDERGDARLIPPAALAEMLAAYAPPLHTVLLNACYSGVHADELRQSKLPFLIAMMAPISDRGAIEFTRGFYDALAAGRDIPFAYAEGCRTIRLLAIGDDHIPVLHKGTTALRRTQTNEHFYLFITVANSVGKTTIAYALAERYHFNAVISTDALRAGLRPWAEQIGSPELLFSSFEVGDKLRERGLELSVEEAFEKQCNAFCRSFDAVIEHSRRKRATAVFEGVNILPTEAFRRVAFHEHSNLLLVTLYLNDPNQHYQRMLTRIADMPGPDADKYPRNFDKIRRLDALVRHRTEDFASTTRGNRVLMIENSGTAAAAVDRIAQRLDEVRAAVSGR